MKKLMLILVTIFIFSCNLKKEKEKLNIQKQKEEIVKKPYKFEYNSLSHLKPNHLISFLIASTYSCSSFAGLVSSKRRFTGAL
jgi:hypothetical protein